MNYLKETYDLRQLINTKAELFYPSLNFSYRQVDHAVAPNNGYSLSLSLNGTIKSLSSNNEGFFQHRLRLRYLHTFPTHTRLLLRNQLARTTIHDIEALPLSLQLFVGGSQSIRGYAYNSIGPGKNLIDGSIEIQQKIIQQFYLATFYDLGDITDKAFDTSKLKDSYGVGIAWIGPIGTLELSGAKRLAPGQQRWTIQFSMGPFL